MNHRSIRQALTTLGEVVSRTGGAIQTGPFGSQLHARDYTLLGTPVVMPFNLGDNEIFKTNVSRVGGEDARRLRRHAVREGDIVVSRRGDVGRRSIIKASQEGWICGTGCLAARFGSNLATVNPEYVALYLGSKTAQTWLQDNAVGGTMPNLNTAILSSLPIWLPPRADQDAIVTALEAAHDEIKQIGTLIAKKRAIKQGMMQQLLTGKTRLHGFSDPWIDVYLGDITRIKTGSRDNQDKEPRGRYPFFVRSATVERINSYSYDCEAILVPGEGGIGTIFHYINGKFEVHQRVYTISHFRSGVSGLFVYYYMNQFFGTHALENSVKATVDSLRLPTFSRFKLHLPARIAEQHAIVNLLGAADEEIYELKRRLAKVQDVKQGMMQQLLTGQTRLPEVEGADE